MGISPEKVFAFTRGPWCRAYWGWTLGNSHCVP